MADKDVILAKISTIQKCLKRIKKTTCLNPETLNDIDKQDIFVLNLQRAVEASIGIAAHVVAPKGLGLPSTARENFKLLLDAKIIGEDMFEKMRSMTGFRNIAIHDYQAMKLEILKSGSSAILSG